MTVYKYIFNHIKKIIPKISNTEIIALKSGGVSIDREIFKGRVDLKKLYALVPNTKINKEMTEKTNNLLNKIGQDNIYPNPNININNLMNELGKTGFLSMIIDKKYNGNRLTISEQSSVLTRLASYNPSLAVSVMVPNSLGPAELLQHYGTENQKNYFLPKLSDGTMIPCFGLTGPNNGSDAVGNVDTGFVELVNDVIKIKITLNKRYITLAPISNLIGIAFNLEDPNKILNNKKSGITVALIESSKRGLIKSTYHNPNNSGFPNGTIKGTIYIEINEVIGGENNIGEGWKMLMECLAVGRGVSLPATANGSSKFVTQSILNYINIRKQFNMKIGDMEAVKEKFIDMYINTWIIHSSVHFTNHILDSGLTPSVLTAIMKQQTTERARNILNNGMDIFAGSGICVGENNFFTKFYNSAPIGITVEGSNTLTRGLIIFGQGLNKSHPYIFPIFESIQNNDLVLFTYNFNNLVLELSHNYLIVLNPLNYLSNNNSIKRLELATLKFSLLTNFIALLGGKIKSKQMISGNMSDILSNIYLSYSLLWFHYHQHNNDKNYNMLRDECINYLLNELEYKMNLVIDNYPLKPFNILLLPLKNKISYSDFENKNKLYKTILENKEMYNIYKNDIFYKNTILEKMEKLNVLDKNTKEYENLYQNIISVGEFKI
jgi:acyl-CoA dehydrogenase